MKICVTGGIGSGKSTVIAELKKLGAFTVSADEINDSMLCEADYVSKLAKIFPDCVSGISVDRPRIRREIIADEKKRLALNSLSHSEIMKRMFTVAKNEKLAFFEVPILSDEYASEFDRIWFVTAPDNVCVERIISRDGKSEEEAKAFVNVQKRDGIIRLATDIIYNENITETSAEVRRLLGELKEKTL